MAEERKPEDAGKEQAAAPEISTPPQPQNKIEITVALDLTTGKLTFGTNTGAATWMLYGMLENAKDLVRDHEKKMALIQSMKDRTRKPNLGANPNHPALRKH